LNKKSILLIVLIIFIPSMSWGAATDYYVTVAGAAGKDGLAWASAFSYSEFEADFEGSQEAGDRYFFEDGTYTITSGLASTGNCTAALPCALIGVKTGTSAEPPTTADWSYGSDRPLFQTGANDYRITPHDHFLVANLNIETGAFYGVSMDVDSILYNLRIDHSSTNASSQAVHFSENGLHIVGCEIISDDNGNITTTGNWGATWINNYLHDSVQCAEMSQFGTFIGNIVDTCTTGLLLTSANETIIGNTFYNSTTCVDGNTRNNATFLNNLFDECTTPVSFTAEYTSNLYDYNSWDGDASSNSNVTEGQNDIDSDITLTNPGSGDFTLPDSTAAEGVGIFGAGANFGLTGDYNTNMGADQTDTQSGGGGSVTVGYGF